MNAQPAARTQPDPSSIEVATLGGGIRVLAISRPDRMNALDPAAASALRQAISDAMEDRALRALVLHGTGAHFCTGFDLKHQRVPGEEGVLAILQDCFVLLQEGPLPSVAAIEGNAFGAGLSLALACDQVVAADNARLCAPFTGIGLLPDVGLVLTLERRVGFGRARRWLVEGTVIDAPAALASGLADEVTAAGAARDAAVAQAVRWTSRAPLAIAAVRQLSRLPASLVAETFAQERTLQAELGSSADFGEGVAAFRQRRKPAFQGR